MRRTSQAMCSLDHTDLADVLTSLPKSQAEPGRHACAGCAYAAGVVAGRKAERAEWRAKVRTLKTKVEDWAHGS